MSEDFSLDSTMKMQLAKYGSDEQGMTIGQAANGLEICLPAYCVKFINDDPFLEQQVDAMAEMVLDVEQRTGKSFDRPLFLTDTPSTLAFATGMASQEDLSNMFPPEMLEELNKGKSEEEKEQYHTLLHLPLVSLMEDSPLSMKDIEGIVLHELGHAATKDVVKMRNDTLLWDESLQKIDKMCVFVMGAPEMTEGITAKMGGNEAFLAEADRLFEKIDNEITDCMKMAAEGNLVSPEHLLDHLYHNPEFMERFDTLAKIGTGDTLKDFTELHDTTVDLLCETIKEGVLVPQGVAATHMHMDVIGKLQSFGQVNSHANEFLADDFATRNHPTPTSYLEKLPDGGASESHPATYRRVERASTLDQERITQLVENDEIDEEKATKHTNEEMRQSDRKAQGIEDVIRQIRERKELPPAIDPMQDHRSCGHNMGR